MKNPNARRFPTLLRDAPPWLPVDWGGDNLVGATAIQAVATGTATPEQQMLAIQTIIEVVCDRDGMSYSPDSQYDTAFAEGKRFVGSQIAKFSKLIYRKMETD